MSLWIFLQILDVFFKRRVNYKVVLNKKVIILVQECLKKWELIGKVIGIIVI